MEIYLNPSLSPEDRAEDLLSKLSLEEKIGQISCVYAKDMASLPQVASYIPNGIGQVSMLELRTVETSSECAALQRAYQEAVMAASPHHIPAIFHMEGLCGPLFQDTTSFPAGISRGSSWDPALERKVGEIVARQEQAMGITHTLAPVLDVTRDARFGRQGESYGEDPTLCAAMGSAYTAGIQSGEVGGRHSDAVAKHFLGFHQSSAGICGSNSDIPERPLREIYAKPFQAAITESGLKGVMPCYCSINGEPVHSSKHLLNDLLREEMGFEGVIFSDYGGVSNIHNAQHSAEDLTEAGAMALKAGVDQECPMPDCYNQDLIRYIRDGKLDETYVNRAAMRVLTAKFRMGLFENPFAMTGHELKEQLHNENDLQVTLRSARESLVLLKNDGVLPMKQAKKIAVIGGQADNARIFFGGYTHMSMAEGVYAARSSMAGVEPMPWQTGMYTPIPGTPIQPDDSPIFDEILHRQKPDCKSLLAQLKADLPETEFVYSYGYPIAGTDNSHHDAAVEACRGADLILMVIGGKHGTSSIASMGEGIDASDIGLPECQEKLILRLKELNIPMVGIHFNGRPCSSDVADENLNAILECWNPSECGAQVISEVLRGEVNPSGKLPVTVARCAGQEPIYYNHAFGSAWHQGGSVGFNDYVDLTHLPRYPFGFGLSYTNFAYSDLQLGAKTLAPTDTLEVSCKVRNTGSVSGAEVVQLYVNDPYASICRPVQELAGFTRVDLNPGEEKTVTFHLKLSQLAFLDREMRWKVERGTLNIRISASSEDIRMEDSVTVTEDCYVDGKNRGFWAEAQVR